jgi:hypothetical protein
MKTENVTVTLPLEEYVKLCKQADYIKPKLEAGAARVFDALVGRLRSHGLFSDADFLETQRKAVLESLQT